MRNIICLIIGIVPLVLVGCRAEETKSSSSDDILKGVRKVDSQADAQHQSAAVAREKAKDRLEGASVGGVDSASKPEGGPDIDLSYAPDQEEGNGRDTGAPDRPDGDHGAPPGKASEEGSGKETDPDSPDPAPHGSGEGYDLPLPPDDGGDEEDPGNPEPAPSDSGEDEDLLPPEGGRDEEGTPPAPTEEQPVSDEDLPPDAAPSEDDGGEPAPETRPESPQKDLVAEYAWVQSAVPGDAWHEKNPLSPGTYQGSGAKIVTCLLTGDRIENISVMPKTFDDENEVAVDRAFKLDERGYPLPLVLHPEEIEQRYQGCPVQQFPLGSRLLGVLKEGVELVLDVELEGRGGSLEVSEAGFTPIRETTGEKVYHSLELSTGQLELSVYKNRVNRRLWLLRWR